MNIKILLTYTEFPEDYIEHVLHVDPAQQPSQDSSRAPQFLRRKLLTSIHHRYAAMQHSSRLLQQFSLPRPADQTTLH